MIMKVHFDTRRSLIYTLQFMAKTYLFGPIADSSDGLIRKVQVDMYTSTDVKTAKREMRYTVTPTAKKIRIMMVLLMSRIINY